MPDLRRSSMMLRDDIASLAASCHEAVLSIAILALLYLWNFFFLR